MKIKNVLLSLISLFAICSCSNNKEPEGPKYEGAHEIAPCADRSEATHEDTPYYTYIDFYNLESKDSLLMISHFETYQQVLSYSCGACSCWMVYNYLDKDGASLYTEQKMADELGSVGGGIGTSGQQIADFFIDKGYNVNYSCQHEKTFAQYIEFKSFVKEYLSDGKPIMVDWAIGGGHWTTIIGFDDMGTDANSDDILIFADSSDAYDHFYDGYTTFAAARFFSMWHEVTPWDGEEIYRQQYVIVEGK